MRWMPTAIILQNPSTTWVKNEMNRNKGNILIILILIPIIIFPLFNSCKMMSKQDWGKTKRKKRLSKEKQIVLNAKWYQTESVCVPDDYHGQHWTQMKQYLSADKRKLIDFSNTQNPRKWSTKGFPTKLD